MIGSPFKLLLCIAALAFVTAVLSIQVNAQSDDAPATTAQHAAPQNSEAIVPTPVPAEQLANRCTATRKLTAQSPAWAGWGANPANWRYQNAMQAGFSVASVTGLKLKWVF